MRVLMTDTVASIDGFHVNIRCQIHRRIVSRSVCGFLRFTFRYQQINIMNLATYHPLARTKKKPVQAQVTKKRINALIPISSRNPLSQRLRQRRIRFRPNLDVTILLNHQIADQSPKHHPSPLIQMRPVIRCPIIDPARIWPNSIDIMRASPVKIYIPRSKGLGYCQGGVALVGEVLDDSRWRAGEGAAGEGGDEDGSALSLAGFFDELA